MTMDVRRRCSETTSSFIVSSGNSPASGVGLQSQQPVLNENSSSPPAKTTPSPPTNSSKVPTKRSFDVAFLMAPDDTNKRRHHQEELKEQLRLVSTNNLLQQYSPPLSDKSRFSEGAIGLLMPSKTEINSDHLTKSAFTKVSSPVRIENLPSPNSMSPALSPDLSYRDSLSPNGRSKSPQQFYGRQVPYFAGKSGLTSPYIYPVPSDKLHSPSDTTTYASPDSKGCTSKTIYQGEVLPYGGLTVAAATYPFPGTFSPASTRVPALLTAAAANVTAALLPSSLAAFTLPAQNVCAKCNISFRMTSDLVYHMRSQHKSDNYLSDSNRRRREQDKLRCPVCNESFRERHHLTRHMTAHQDKDGDKLDDETDPLVSGKLHK